MGSSEQIKNTIGKLVCDCDEKNDGDDDDDNDVDEQQKKSDTFVATKDQGSKCAVWSDEATQKWR